MRRIESGDNFEYGWLDDEETIICLEITGTWTWVEAVHVITRVNDVIAATPRPLYSLLHFKDQYFLPQSGSVASIRRLISFDNPNEQLIILINTNHFLTRLTHTVSSAYGLGRLFGKFRFVYTLEEATALVEEAKRVRSCLPQ